MVVVVVVTEQHVDEVLLVVLGEKEPVRALVVVAMVVVEEKELVQALVVIVVLMLIEKRCKLQVEYHFH